MWPVPVCECEGKKKSPGATKLSSDYYFHTQRADDAEDEGTMDMVSEDDAYCPSSRATKGLTTLLSCS